MRDAQGSYIEVRWMGQLLVTDNMYIGRRVKPYRSVVVKVLHVRSNASKLGRSHALLRYNYDPCRLIHEEPIST